MALLLLLCLTLACLPVDWPHPILGLGPTGSAVLTGAGVVALLLVARIFTAITIHTLTINPENRESISRVHGLRRFFFLFLNLATFAGILLAAGWGRTVQDALQFHDRFLPGGELVTLAPFLIVMIGSWSIFYDAERALHLSNPVAIFRGEFWSRGGYVGFLLRHHLLTLFMPLLLMIGQMSVLRAAPDFFEHDYAKIIAFVGAFLFMLLLPSLVPFILGLRRMPAGPVRDRLAAAAVRLRVRYRDLYIWDTRGNLATAMVTGIVPWLRQIVFTDLLLATLTDDEVEAVFGHEVGHVRHGHLVYYVVFLLLSFLTLGAVYQQSEYYLPTGNLMLVLTVVITGCYLFLVFGFVSRRCERQADVFGCKAVSCAEPGCAAHSPATPLIPGGKGLCRTGVGTFVRALERVEEINGMARGSVHSGRVGIFRRMAGLLRLLGVWLATWQHSTISNRVAFLRTLADEPERERRFQWRVTLMRWGLLVVLVGGVLCTVVFARGGWREFVGWM